jgi:rhodanese-related sulfurtransferase
MSMPEISPEQLREKLDRGEEIILLDVRESYEYEEDNLGGELIPLGTLMMRLPEIEQYKNREIVIHCRSGSRSAVAQQLLLRQGFNNVSNLAGGILAFRESIK